MLNGAHCMISRRAEMPRVRERGSCHAVLTSLLDHHIHDAWCLMQAQSAIAVVRGGDISLADDAHVRPRVDILRLVALHIHPEHVGNAMRINTVQVGVEQHIGGQVGIFVGQSHLEEYRAGCLSHDGRHNPYRILIRDVEMFKHIDYPFGSSLR